MCFFKENLFCSMFYTIIKIFVAFSKKSVYTDIAVGIIFPSRFSQSSQNMYFCFCRNSIIYDVYTVKNTKIKKHILWGSRKQILKTWFFEKSETLKSVTWNPVAINRLFEMKPVSCNRLLWVKPVLCNRLL